VVAHSNFECCQEYLQYETSGDDGSRSIISGGVTDSIHYTHQRSSQYSREAGKVRKYTEYSFAAHDKNRLDSGHPIDSWRVVPETKPVSLDEPGNYSLYAYTTATTTTTTRYEGIPIPFEMVEK